MIPRSIAQAIVGDNGLHSHSDGFLADWRPDVERVVEAFGLPRGTSTPDCLFAIPFARRYVAVVSASGRKFRFLILGRSLYDAIPDPFAIADRFPPKWDGPLSDLEWPPEPLPKRTVAQIDHIFKHGDGPFLLGACQTLVDGSRIAINRGQPHPALVRDLWNLLPDSTRRQSWPATFAYSTTLGFALAIFPDVPVGGLLGYLTEDQARDYPESRYERELQTAVEAGDQATVDRLFARRTSVETLRLAIWIVLGAAVLAMAGRLLMR